MVELPFGCGERWYAATYVGHPSHAIDWNLGGAGESDFGRPVLAGAGGTVHVRHDEGYGLYVDVDHGGGWRSRYAHLSSVDVVSGATVTARTVVGRVGRSGKATGSHLHHEQLLNGVRVPIAARGVRIVPTFSTRGASYVSTNCAAPPAATVTPVPAAPAPEPVAAPVEAPRPQPSAQPAVRVSRRSSDQLAPGVLPMAQPRGISLAD